MNRLTGLKDVDREVLKHVDDEQLLKVCSMDRRMWKDVCDDNFLRRRLLKYPGIEKYKTEEENWKEFFLRSIYYISRMKENFSFEYTEGNFKRQYKFLTEYMGNYEYLLTYSARMGEFSLVKFALEKGADIHTSLDIALRYASLKGHLEIVKYLIEFGADIHAKGDGAFRSSRIFTKMIWKFGNFLNYKICKIKEKEYERLY